ncbi:MAG: ATP-binding protein, partial [Planctomycetales bacterium]
GGEIVATSYCGKDWYELEIADSGEGVEGDLRQQTFAPFYSTKGKGLGLGLTVVAQIAAAHGGEVDVLNCPEGGAAYTLRFPSRAAAAKAAA